MLRELANHILTPIAIAGALLTALGISLWMDTTSEATRALLPWASCGCGTYFLAGIAIMITTVIAYDKLNPEQPTSKGDNTMWTALLITIGASVGAWRCTHDIATAVIAPLVLLAAAAVILREVAPCIEWTPRIG